MLWRPGYSTRIRQNVERPLLSVQTLEGEVVDLPSGGPVIGGFGPLAGAELGIWRRLLGEAGYDPLTVYIRTRWMPRERRDLAASIAPSLHSRTQLGSDPDGVWSSFIEPDRPERSFALSLGAGLLMVGPPTEEAWDEFFQSLRRSA